MQRNHGDREVQPKPLNELIEEGLQIVETDAQPEFIMPEDDGYVDFVGRTAGPAPTLPDIEPAVRLECARIAATSYGSTGCFDDEALLRRAEEIFKYTRDGLA